MGLKPMASLSLALSTGYFTLLLIMVLVLLIAPPGAEYLVTLIALLMLGLGLFFLPLTSAHAQMKRAKASLKATVRKRWQAVLASQLSPPIATGATMPKPGNLSDVTALDILERKVNAVHTWPFDLKILSKLGAMVLGIVLSLVTRVVGNLLGL
jgi:hypothetical protein